MRGVPARWGDPARDIPTLLDPVQAEEHHEPGPLPPFRPGPLLHLFGKGPGGKDSRPQEGVPAGRGGGVFSNCGRFGRGNTLVIKMITCNFFCIGEFIS